MCHSKQHDCPVGNSRELERARMVVAHVLPSAPHPYAKELRVTDGYPGCDWIWETHFTDNDSTKSTTFVFTGPSFTVAYILFHLD
jgi:hypothetical protein